jgi:hypothetical protein
MKGGCAVGKKSGAGGCKTGKKKGPPTKPKTEATKVKGLKAKLDTKKKELAKLQEMKRKRDEKKPMVKKTKPKFKVVKTLKKPVGTLKPLPAVEKPKRKPKFKIKPAALPELKAITGLTKEQANAMSPEQLFGMLPKELATNIVLRPKETGVKVGTPRLSETQLKDKIMEILKINNPRIRIDSGNAKTKGNKILTQALKTAKFKRPRNMDWRNFGVLRTEKAFSKPEKARSLLNSLKSQLLTTKSIKAKK